MTSWRNRLASSSRACRIALQISLAALGEILKSLPLAFTPSPRPLFAEYPQLGICDTRNLSQSDKATLLNFLRTMHG